MSIFAQRSQRKSYNFLSNPAYSEFCRSNWKTLHRFPRVVYQFSWSIGIFSPVFWSKGARPIEVSEIAQLGGVGVLPNCSRLQSSLRHCAAPPQHRKIRTALGGGARPDQGIFRFLPPAPRLSKSGLGTWRGWCLCHPRFLVI